MFEDEDEDEDGEESKCQMPSLLEVLYAPDAGGVRSRMHSAPWDRERRCAQARPRPDARAEAWSSVQDIPVAFLHLPHLIDD